MWNFLRDPVGFNVNNRQAEEKLVGAELQPLAKLVYSSMSCKSSAISAVFK